MIKASPAGSGLQLLPGQGKLTGMQNILEKLSAKDDGESKPSSVTSAIT